MGLNAAAIALGLCISAGFLVAERRATSRDAVLFAAALIATVWPTVEHLIRRTVARGTSLIVGAVHGVVASTTFELGGLAFVIPAVLFGLAGVLPSIPGQWRRALTHVGRVLTVPLGLVLMVSVAGIAFVPVIFVFFVRWAWTRPSAVARFLFGFFGGITGVYTVGVAIMSVGAGYPQFLAFDAPVVVGTVVAVRHRREHRPSMNMPGIEGLACGATLMLAALALLWWWPVWR